MLKDLPPQFDRHSQEPAAQTGTSEHHRAQILLLASVGHNNEAIATVIANKLAPAKCQYQPLQLGYILEFTSIHTTAVS